MADTLNLQVEAELEEDFIDSLITTAFEGGINYWLHHVEIRHPDGSRPKGTPVSTWAAEALEKGGSIIFVEVGDKTVDEGKKTDPLTKEKLLAGLVKWGRYHAIPLTTENGKTVIDICNIDASMADEILQYALFGKVVFG